jgi:hypothetical protein
LAYLSEAGVFFVAIIKKTAQLQELETITVLSVFLLLLNLFLHKQAFIYAALALLLTGLFIKPAARNISRIWLNFAELLGAVNCKIILSLVFFLFLTPLAFLYRLFTKNPLQLKNTSETKSLYREREHRFNPADFEKMW